MTLALAWTRRVNATEEVVLAADSRLRFGKAWDGCSKIFPLSRGDSALAFAGDTHYAYPMVHQVVNAVEMFSKARSRAMDLGALRGHIVRVFNDMEQWIHDEPKGRAGKDPPSITFILAGYSWVSADFKIWTIYYKASARQFVFHTPTLWHGTHLAMAGDAFPEFKKRLYALLKKKGKSKEDGFDYEPFEVLRDMIRNKSDPSIGGPPSILKIYKHMNSMPYSVLWPDAAKGLPTVLGRPLLDYERTSYLLFDPDKLETVEPRDPSRADELAEGQGRNIVPEEPKK